MSEWYEGICVLGHFQKAFCTRPLAQLHHSAALAASGRSCSRSGAEGRLSLSSTSRQKSSDHIRQKATSSFRPRSSPHLPARELSIPFGQLVSCPSPSPAAPAPGEFPPEPGAGGTPAACPRAAWARRLASELPAGAEAPPGRGRAGARQGLRSASSAGGDNTAPAESQTGPPDAPHPPQLLRRQNATALGARLKAVPCSYSRAGLRRPAQLGWCAQVEEHPCVVTELREQPQRVSQRGY